MKARDRDIIKEAYKRYEYALSAAKDNWDRAKAALKFRDLQQWDEDIKQSREGDKEGPRPCLVVDKTNQYVNQVKNDQRQNRPSIKIRPVDDDADIKTAEVINGLVRHIQDCSRASIAYDTAHEAAVDGGFGYWRVTTEYIDDTTLDQEPRIKRIRNRFTVLLDPAREEPDGSDSKYAFVFERMDKDDFKAEYPSAKVVSFQDHTGIAKEWQGEDDLTVVEYFRIVSERKTIKIGDESRVVKKPKVEWYKLTASEILDERELPGTYIPIVEVVGNDIDIEGKRMLSGLIRGAMDAQRMYNYASSAFVEMVALAPRAPYVAAEGQVEGREGDWKSANRRNHSVLQYKPVIEGDHLVPPPQRQQLPGIPTGWQQAMSNFEHDVQASMGMYASSLGEQTEATSGRQELALQKKGDTATFHYSDNLATAIQHTGRILLQYIPVYYNRAKVIRILGEDGSEDYARIDPEQKEAVREIVGKDGKRVSYYNLGFGKYDVTATSGPGFTTKRMEGAQYMMDMIASKPELIQIVGDIAFRALDMPYADEIAERLKKMLPPQLQDNEESDLPEEVRNAIQQAQAALEQREMLLQQQASEFAKIGEAASQDAQKAKDAKAALEKEAIELQANKQILAATERAMKAEIESAQMKAEQSLQDMIEKANAESQEVEGARNAHWSEELGPQIVQSHEQMMQAMQAVLAAVAAPKVKRTRAVGPSGQTYDVETVETLQ